MNFEINDILYTKDGRKSGNLVVIDKYPTNPNPKIFNLVATRYQLISDYGNIIESYLLNYKKQFYAKTGKATESHKYYNYKLNHPELFL